MIRFSDLDTENTLLSTAWIKQKFSSISDLKPRDFYYENNRKFFELIQQMYIDNISYEFANYRMFKTELLTDAYLTNLLSFGETMQSNCKLQKDALKELSAKRKYIAELETAKKKIEDGNLISDVYDYIDNFNRDIALDTVAECSDMMELTTEDLELFKRPDNNVRTFLPDIDDRIIGFYPKQLILIAGRPGMGKTTLAQNICVNNAKAGNKVVFFSLEMSKQELYIKMLSNETKIDSMDLERQLYSGNCPLKDKIIEGQKKIKEYAKNIIVYDNVFNLTEIEKEIRRQTEFNGADLIMIDYLQLVEATGNNDTEVISKISRGFKKSAQVLDIPIVALSQLNRESTKRKFPELQDLRGSGSLEQDSNRVLFIHQTPDQEAIDKRITAVSIAKNRGGSLGFIDVFYDKHIHNIKCIDKYNEVNFKDDGRYGD